MKSLLLSISMVFMFVFSYGQNFEIPNLTLEQKHDRTLSLAYANIITGITNAKIVGMTTADYSAFCGDQFKTTWNKKGGFKSFVNGSLNNFETFRRTQDPEIIILEQSSSKVVIKWKISFKDLFSNGSIFEVGYEDLLLWFDIVNQKIAAYMGSTYEQEVLEDDWLQITFKK